MAEISKRTAIARLVSDLIRSDNIIDEAEMIALDEFEDVYGIRQQNLVEAQLITFSQAVSVLRDNLDTISKEKLLRQLCRIAMIDSVCTEQEALLLTAIDYCLDSDYGTGADMLTCESDTIVGTNNKFIVYVESECDEEINEEIQDEKIFQAICSEMRLYGFDFIYIPFIVSELKKKSHQYMRKVLKYMSPNFDDNTVDDIYDRMLTMTTPQFTSDLLFKKMDLKVSNTDPALMINIGSSLVPYCKEIPESKVYTEFLKINITGDAYDAVHHFISVFSKYLTGTFHPSAMLIKNKLKYFGFYKALLDLMVFARSDSNLRINILNKREVIKFTDTNETLRLKPNEAAIYCMILQQTLCDEVNHGLLYDSTGRKKAELNSIYNKVYGTISGSESSKDYNAGIVQVVSHIRKALRELRLLKNVNAFLPVKDEVNGVYTIKAGKDAIKVMEMDGKTTKELILSDFWTKM